MTIPDWNERYLAQLRSQTMDENPTPLLVETASELAPGKALDLACGSGRNALWLAKRGWSTNAVDGSDAAIAALRAKAVELGIGVEGVVADLEKGEYSIAEESWDLILMAFY